MKKLSIYWALSLYLFAFSLQAATVTPPAVNPVGLAYQAEFYEHDGSDVLYLIDKESLSVFRWSTANNAYLSSWTLLDSPTWTTLSTAHNRLYLGYANGKISYFDLSLNNPVETLFTNLTFSVEGLLSVGNHLFAADLSGTWGTYYSFDINAASIDSITGSQTGSQYVWNPVNHRIYHYNPFLGNRIDWQELDPATGLFTLNGRAPYQQNPFAILNSPLHVGDDGQYLLNGAGHILDATSLNQLNSLPNEIADAAWVNGTLITLKKDTATLQFWDSNYQLTASYPLSEADSARIFSLNGQLLLVKQRLSGSEFQLYDLSNLPDRDGDGIHDLTDNCISILNPMQIDNDADGQGNLCDLDDDNDSLPDTLENQLGLNPLDASDADADLDNDGFSNRVEYLHGSVLNDVTSFPSAALSTYQEGFENGWPSIWFNPSQNNLGWNIQAGGFEGQQSLASTPFNAANLSSETNFTALFDQEGSLSFHFKSFGDYAFAYKLHVLVDGVVFPYTSFYDPNFWQPANITVPAGLHTITFKVVSSFLQGNESNSYFLIDNIQFGSDIDQDGIIDTLDNCPIAYNPDQIDADQDGLGYECDPQPSIANIHTDSDNDLVADFYDNCPNLANLSQDDLDSDKIGDLCDEDIDGDGIDNITEQLHLFLNERDSSDAYADFDLDGISNRDEILLGSAPDDPSAIPTISLLDYYPLGNMTWNYSDSFNNLQIIMQPTSTTGQFKVEYRANGILASIDYIELRANGIYLTQSAIKDPAGKLIINYQNFLIIPSQIDLKGSTTSNWSAVALQNRQTSTLQNCSQTISSISIKKQPWKGNSYLAVNLRNQASCPNNGSIIDLRSTFLQGVGEITIEQLTLESLVTNSSNSISAPTSSNGNGNSSSGGGGGGGSLSWLTLLLFGLRYRSPQLKRG